MIIECFTNYNASNFHISTCKMAIFSYDAHSFKYFSTALAVMTISAAVNLPFSERRAMIFSLLFSFQNLHKILIHVDVDRAIAGEGTSAFAVMTISAAVNLPIKTQKHFL